MPHAHLDVALPVQRGHIFENLQSLSEKTERIYLAMGNALPDLLSELERGFDDARTLIGYFSGQRRVALGVSTDDTRVGDVLQDAKAVMTDASGFFSSMEESDQANFQSINVGIQNLAHLDEKLKAIREDSEEMELISLNAMMVALKAGQSGKAFSVITEELKALSSDTIGYTERLTDAGKKLLGLFYGYRKDIERIERFQKDFYLGFRDKLSASFENFRLGVAKMAEILLQVIDGAAGTKKPLERIMLEIQNQDIIRQSIQHVVLSLRDAQAGAGESGTRTPEDALDELSFLAMLPDLSGALLRDVATHIRSGIDVFQSSLEELRGLLENAEEEKRTFVEYFDSGENALAKIFEESIQGMSGLLEGVERSMKEKGKLSPEGVTILEELKLLQESFEEFVAFVDRFRSVDVAARIELAKQPVLRDKGQTMGSLTSWAGRIADDVKAAKDIIKETIKQIETTIRHFAFDVEKGALKVGALVLSIRGVYARLTDAKDFLSHTMKKFSLYTNRFFSLIDGLRAQVGELEELGALIEGIIGEFVDLGTEIVSRKEEALAKSGLSLWTIRDNRLKVMIGRFTILSHKKTAAELGGFTVEEGGKPGELTIFQH